MSINDFVFLYPRLDAHRAALLVQAQQGLSLAELQMCGASHHSDAACSPTGGLPVPETHLRDLQATLRGLCDDFGFPSALKTSKQAEFDRVCGTILRRDMRIVPADASEEGVWSFVSLVLVPELAPWRFPSRHEDRLLGKPRNTLRRLWWRAHVLGPDLTWVPPGCTPLNEDESVQIMERPTIAKSARLAQQLKQVLWRFESKGFGGNRAELLRDVIKLIRAERSHIAMDAMHNSVLAAYLDEIVAEAINRFSTSTSDESAGQASPTKSWNGTPAGLLE